MVGTESVEKAVCGGRRPAVRVMVALLALYAAPALAGSCVVPPELWDRPRSGAAVAASVPIRPCIQEMIDSSTSSMLIRHAAGSDLQAEELRAWLIALAIDARRIALAPGAAMAEPMVLEVGAGR